MDLRLDAEQHDRIAAFADVGRRVAALRTGGGAGATGEAWAICAGAGLTGLIVDRAHGGLGLGALDAVLALEAFGSTCPDAGLAFALGAQLFSVAAPLERFGTDAQRAASLVPMCAGAVVGAHALTEPSSGSDAFSLATSATAVDGGWRLDGSKAFITSAPIADLLLVFATTDRSRGWAGVSAFLVPADAPGVAVDLPQRAIGLAGATLGQVVLDGVQLPATAMLGAAGAGLAVFDHSMGWERGCILAPVVGAMATQAGVLAAMGASPAAVGGAAGRARRASLLLRRMAWERDQGGRVDRLAPLVKLLVSQGWVASCEAVLAAQGAAGLLASEVAATDRLDAVATRIYSGTDEIQRDLLAHTLGLR